jgi:hypothetical protein
MYFSSLTATLNQFRNGPLTRFDTRLHRRGASNRAMNLAEVVISEVHRHCSFKIYQLFAEGVGQASKPAAVHSDGVILLLDVRGCDPANLWRSSDDALLNFNHFRRKKRLFQFKRKN